MNYLLIIILIFTGIITIQTLRHDCFFSGERAKRLIKNNEGQTSGVFITAT